MFCRRDIGKAIDEAFQTCTGRIVHLRHKLRLVFRLIDDKNIPVLVVYHNFRITHITIELIGHLGGKAVIFIIEIMQDIVFDIALDYILISQRHTVYCNGVVFRYRDTDTGVEPQLIKVKAFGFHFPRI